ncbi:TylF/MycF/NovP-related O-methyltransferase [Nocardioides sp. MAHUQ-72]|uniref:TylF/MycF/NovP-related O-methyltransferase n=1 Tax=unclassified Nocardioides TaxID=2615069 RepID=UPI0036239CF3
MRKAAARLGGNEPAPAPAPAPPKKPKYPLDYDPAACEVIDLVKPYTMTSHEKLYALITAVRYVVDARVEGALVECGVWRGGSMHAIARTLDERGVHDRELHLFDTFQGMTEPTERDRKIKGDRRADELLETSAKNTWVWAVASIEDVREGLQTLPYPYERFHLVKGPVEETIPEHCPEKIALLRLDTDWYESTRHELEHMYDRLQPGGILIIDDYGTWQGSKEATDEFVARLDKPLMLMRAGRSRIAVKPG